MRTKARTDGNHQQIVEGLRKFGCSVSSLHQIGKGVPDILCGHVAKSGLKVNILFEIKDGSLPPSKRKLTPDEVQFHNDWKGPLFIITSLDEAIKILQQ
jgi:hypothetical protein